jgi:hypothetical protein
MANELPRTLWYDRERDNATCGFSERPEDAPCGAIAVEHGVVADPSASLLSCDRHKPNLVRNADWHHPTTPACRDPRAIFTWDDLIGTNFCYVPDEPAEEHSVTRAQDSVTVGASARLAPPAPTERNTQP